jgi:hypothetical protein
MPKDQCRHLSCDKNTMLCKVKGMREKGTPELSAMAPRVCVNLKLSQSKSLVKIKGESRHRQPVSGLGRVTCLLLLSRLLSLCAHNTPSSLMSVLVGPVCTSLNSVHVLCAHTCTHMHISCLEYPYDWLVGMHVDAGSSCMSSSLGQMHSRPCGLTHLAEAKDRTF